MSIFRSPILHPIPRVDFTFLIAVGCTVGIIATLWVLYRAYRLLLITYCTSMSRCAGNTSHPITPVPPQPLHHQP